MQVGDGPGSSRGAREIVAALSRLLLVLQFGDPDHSGGVAGIRLLRLFRLLLLGDLRLGGLCLLHQADDLFQPNLARRRPVLAVGDLLRLEETGLDQVYAAFTLQLGERCSIRSRESALDLFGQSATVDDVKDLLLDLLRGGAGDGCGDAVGFLAARRISLVLTLCLFLSRLLTALRGRCRLPIFSRFDVTRSQQAAELAHPAGQRVVCRCPVVLGFLLQLFGLCSVLFCGFGRLRGHGVKSLYHKSFRQVQAVDDTLYCRVYRRGGLQRRRCRVDFQSQNRNLVRQHFFSRDRPLF